MRKFIRDILREGEGGEGASGGSGDGGGGGSIFADAGNAAPPAGDGTPPANTPPAGDPPPGDSDPNINNARNDGAEMQTPTWFKGLYDETGRINKENLAHLPDGIKKHQKVFERYDSIDSIFNAFSNSITLNGKKGDLSAYERPGEDAPQEAKDKHSSFLKVANNVPDKIEDYGLNKPEGVDQEAWDNSGVKPFLEAAQKHSLSPESVKELFEMQQAHQAQQNEAYASEIAVYNSGEMEKLKQEHKSQFPEVKAKAERVLSRYGMSDDAMGSAENVNGLHKIALALGEDKLPAHNSDPSGGITDRQKAMSILSDKSNPLYAAYHDQNHPQHDEAVSLRSKYNQNWIASQKK